MQPSDESRLHSAVEVRASSIHGSGLVATADIPAGDVVAHLGGRIVSTDQLRRRLAAADSRDPSRYVDTITVTEDPISSCLRAAPSIT